MSRVKISSDSVQICNENNVPGIYITNVRILCQTQSPPPEPWPNVSPPSGWKSPCDGVIVDGREWMMFSNSACFAHSMGSVGRNRRQYVTMSSILDHWIREHSKSEQSSDCFLASSIRAEMLGSKRVLGSYRYCRLLLLRSAF